MFEKIICENKVSYYRSKLLVENGITHGFFTRFSGVSKGAFSSLNVSEARRDVNGESDSRENVFENIKRALSSLGVVVENAVIASQVHKNEVLKVESSHAGRGIVPTLEKMPDCDGLFLDMSIQGIDAVCVKTADCVPIILASKDGGQVCAVHAGWRGTCADIVTVAAGKFSCKKEEILCAIGPCIGSCCYNVGYEVYESVFELFSQKGIEKYAKDMFEKTNDGKMRADLAKINKTLLLNFDLPCENIDVSGICTCCHDDEFFSHRASGGYSGTFLTAVKRN